MCLTTGKIKIFYSVQNNKLIKYIDKSSIRDYHWKITLILKIFIFNFEKVYIFEYVVLVSI